jgi:predicted DCC family thiol-disulfide oxidoreductase YuxK
LTEQTQATKQAPGLASIGDRPNADVVIYDGHCKFCTAQVQRLASWDRGDRLAFLSLHDPITRERFPDLTHDQLMQQMYVIDRSGTRHGGASALRYLTRRLPSLWFLAPLLHIPFTLPIWQWLYRRLAERRYRLRGGDPCHDGSCPVR